MTDRTDPLALALLIGQTGHFPIEGKKEVQVALNISLGSAPQLIA